VNVETKSLREFERNIVKNFLDVIILAMLKHSSALSGYDVMEHIQKKFGLLLSSGTVYSLLYSMERNGMIRGELIDGKRKYVLTKAGMSKIDAVLNSREDIQRFMLTLLES
jgi:DNA-binding PadR family transcriptional regulator